MQFCKFNKSLHKIVNPQLAITYNKLKNQFNMYVAIAINTQNTNM